MASPSRPGLRARPTRIARVASRVTAIEVRSGLALARAGRRAAGILAAPAPAPEPAS